jgi:hypothetical protein
MQNHTKDFATACGADSSLLGTPKKKGARRLPDHSAIKMHKNLKITGTAGTT